MVGGGTCLSIKSIETENDEQLTMLAAREE